jgi:hypothetical protein
MALDNKLERKFRRIYGADLLPVGLSESVLCDIIEWDGFLKRNMDLEFINLVDILKMPDDKRSNLMSRLSGVPLQIATFKQITIDQEFDIKGGADIPNFAASISAEVGFSNFLNFVIEDVQAKVLARELKVELIRMIKQAKDEDRKYFRKELKKLFFIDKLYYAGKASFEVSSSAKANLEAALSTSGLANPGIAFTSSGSIKVTTGGSLDIPFAAGIEPCSDLID